MEISPRRNSQGPHRSSTVELMNTINLQPMKKKNEDVHLYLCSFEKTTELKGWPRENWVTLIRPFINYKAQTIFKALPMHYAKDFE